MPAGTIFSLDLQRGFGFLREHGGGAELFFHRSALESGLDFDHRLRELDVLFDVRSGRRGPEAVNVRMMHRGPAR